MQESMEPGARLLTNQKQARYFDAVVDLFDQEQPPHILRNLELIVEAAEIQAGDTVLDVGAGVGVLIPLIRSYKPGRTLACEISAKMLSRLAEKFPEVETHLSDISEMKLPDGCLNVIFMNAVFPNLVDKPKALANSARMLAPSGRLIISHPEGRIFVERLREVVPFPLDPLPIFPQLRRLVKDLPFLVIRYEDSSDFYLAVLERQAFPRMA